MVYTIVNTVYNKHYNIYSTKYKRIKILKRRNNKTH